MIWLCQSEKLQLLFYPFFIAPAGQRTSALVNFAIGSLFKVIFDGRSLESSATPLPSQALRRARTTNNYLPKIALSSRYDHVYGPGGEEYACDVEDSASRLLDDQSRIAPARDNETKADAAGPMDHDAKKAGQEARLRWFQQRRVSK